MWHLRWLAAGMVMFCSSTWSAEGWKAGAARIPITPEKLMWMAGYGARDKPAEGKETELWAKALVLEDAHDLAELARGHVFGKVGKAPDVGKQDRGIDRYMALLFDVPKRSLADGADIGIHLAAGDAEGPKGNRQRAADRDRHMHLIPTAATNIGTPGADGIHSATSERLGARYAGVRG